MATYIQGVTDTALNPVSYTPDFSFLSNALNKATMRYEKNFKQLADGYSEILNTPILNKGVDERRNQYLNEIKDKLKEVSTTDLSIQSNVNQAEALYAPFWEDKEMIAHMADTKKRYAEFSKQKAIAAQNPDYDSATPEYVMSYNMNKIANSKDPNIIKDVPLTEAVALPNNIKKFQEWLHENEYSQTASGRDNNGTLWEQVNGQGYQKSYSELFKIYLGEGAAKQYNMYGEYAKILAIQDIKAKEKNPEMSDDEAINLLPKYRMDSIREGLDNQLKYIRDEYSAIDQNSKTALANNDKDKLNEIDKRVAELNALEKDVNNNIKVLTDGTNIDGLTKEKFLETITRNPTSYFANLKLDADAKKAGYMAASNQKFTLKKDEAFIEARKMEMDAAKEADKEARKVQEEKEKAELEKKKDVTETIPNVQVSLVSQAQPMKTIEVMDKQIRELHQDAINDYRDVFVSGKSIYLTELVKSQEASILLDGLASGKKDANYTKTYNTVLERLKKMPTVDIKNINGPLQLLTAIKNEYSRSFNVLLNTHQKNKENKVYDPSLNNTIALELDAVFNRLNTANEKLNKASLLRQSYDKAIAPKLMDPKYDKITVKDKNGNASFLTADAIVENYKYPREIAAQYVDGSLNIETKTIQAYKKPKDKNFIALESMTVPGLVYYTKKQYLAKGSDGQTHDVTDIVAKHGMPKEFKKEYEKSLTNIYNNIDRNVLKDFEDYTGKMGYVLTFNSPDTDKALADKYARDFMVNYTTKITYEDDLPKIIGYTDKDDIKLINDIVLTKVNSSVVGGLTSMSLYPIGAGDPTKRNIKLKYDINSLGLSAEEKKQLQDIHFDGDLWLELRDDANVQGFPKNVLAYYNILTSSNRNKVYEQTPEEAKAGLYYRFYKDQNNRVYFNAGQEVARQVATSNNSKDVSYQIINAVPGATANEQMYNSESFTPLPDGFTIDDMLETLKNSYISRFNLNSNVQASTNKVVDNDGMSKQAASSIYERIQNGIKNQ